MPRAPKKCAKPDCPVRIVASTYCPEHTPKWRGSTKSSTVRRSRSQRERILERDPICRCRGCRKCGPAGCVRASTEDDHIVNVGRGGQHDVNDDSNRQGLCSPCHSEKTQLEAQAARRLREMPPPF